jgi:hypothetical protein
MKLVYSSLQRIVLFYLADETGLFKLAEDCSILLGRMKVR